jgi:hypothetical protein
MEAQQRDGMEQLVARCLVTCQSVSTCTFPWMLMWCSWSTREFSQEGNQFLIFLQSMPSDHFLKKKNMLCLTSTSPEWTILSNLIPCLKIPSVGLLRSWSEESSTILISLQWCWFIHTQPSRWVFLKGDKDSVPSHNSAEPKGRNHGPVFLLLSFKSSSLPPDAKQEGKSKRFWKGNCERELDEFSLYYELPSLSIRGCCWKVWDLKAVISCHSAAFTIVHIFFHYCHTYIL